MWWPFILNSLSIYIFATIKTTTTVTTKGTTAPTEKKVPTTATSLITTA